MLFDNKKILHRWKSCFLTFPMVPHLWGTSICEMSSRAENVGCAHEKCDKSPLPMPKSSHTPDSHGCQEPAMTALHHQAHLHWNLNMWRNIMFSDESRICLRHLDRRVTVWRRRRERFADCCTNRVGVKRMGWPAVLTSTPLNPILWPTQRRWLTWDKRWLKNGMPSHSRVSRLVTSMRRGCGCVWFFHMLLRLLVKLINC